MNSTVTKRGIAAVFCGVASVVLCLLIAAFITTAQKRRGSTQYAITAPTNSPTDSFMPSISKVPTMRPSVTPTLSAIPSHQPSAIPSSNPTLSTSPTSQPSQQPTISSSPSSEPSLNPTISTSPSSKPSEQPTLSTSPSDKPSSAPSTSTMPTDFPSSVPSSIPSEYPSAIPSFKPSISLSPSNEPSSVPSAVPSETKPIITRIIKSDSSGSALAVGAACFILMASTAFHLRRRKNNSDTSDLKYSQNDRSGNHLQYSSDSVVAISSDSVEKAGAAKCSTNKGRNKKVDDEDLEDGRGDPNSVYNKLMAGNINNIMAVMDMTEAIHVPKIFTRQKEKISDSDDKKSVVDSVEVTPKACKPVRVVSRLSPMFSPMKEFSIKMKERKRRSVTAKYQKSRSVACLDLPSMHGSSLDSEDSPVGTSEFKPASSIKNEATQVDEVHNIEEPYDAPTESETSDAKALSLHHSAEPTSPSYQADVSIGSSLQFTYEEELLNSGRYDDGFSFRDVYFDPENELYECRVPTGLLGILVDSTPLGLRVQKINPTSPLCNIVSAGDIIIGVNDVDVVGLESCVFWQLVSRRANKHSGCCLVIMKI